MPLPGLWIIASEPLPGVHRFAKFLLQATGIRLSSTELCVKTMFGSCSGGTTNGGLYMEMIGSILASAAGIGSLICLILVK